MTNNYYKKDANGDETLYLNNKDGYYLKFEKIDLGEKVSLYHKNNQNQPVFIFNSLMKSCGYSFKFLGSMQKCSFAIEFSKKRIKLIQPGSLRGREERERPFYVFSLLHEIGHSCLHNSQGIGLEKLKRELQAWDWAIEQAQVLLPEYLESVNKEGLKFFIIECLRMVKMGRHQESA